MNRLLLPLVALLASCGTSGPPAPPLTGEIKLIEQGFEDKGGTVSMFPVVGTLTLVITPEGDASSVLKRDILTDIERRRGLYNSERWELHTKAEAWAAKTGAEEAPHGKIWGILTYGTHKVSWQKGDSLSPELTDLIHYLEVLAQSLNEVRKRG